MAMMSKNALHSAALAFRQTARRGGRVVEGAPLLRDRARITAVKNLQAFPIIYQIALNKRLHRFAIILRSAVLFAFVPLGWHSCYKAEEEVR